MAKVVIFGTRDFAELAHFYLSEDSPHDVAAFCLNEAFMPEEPTFKGMPVVAFEDVLNHYDPSSYSFFVPMSGRRMNRDRRAIYEAIKKEGYRFISYVSSKATLFPGTEIGENCFILENNTIQPFTRIGNNVVLWSGNHIGHHSKIHDHVFVTSHVVLSGHCEVESHAFLGVNSTIRDGVRLGEGSLVAMGACVIADTEPWQVYKGVPAKASGTSNGALER